MKGCSFTIALAGLMSAGAAVAAPVEATLLSQPDVPGRLVLDHFPENGWVVQQFGELVEVRFPNSELGVVVEADLPAKLPGRLSELTVETSPDGMTMRFQLACDCAVAVQGDGIATLDIQIVGEPGTGAGSVSDMPEAEARGNGRVPIPPRKPSRDVLGVEQDLAEAGPSEPISVDEARERLLQQLRRAAEAGIVDFDEPDAHYAQPLADATEAPAQGGEAMASAQPAVPGSDQLEQQSVPSVVEKESALAGGISPVPKQASGAIEGDPNSSEQLTLVATEPECFSSEAFVFPESLRPEQLAVSLAEHRRQLIGEFDRPNPDAALELSKTLIGAGMGHEALAVLEDFAEASPETALYADMARLLIGEDLSSRSSLRRDDCLGDQAIWRAYLSAEEGRAFGAVEDDRAAGRAIERVPMMVRQKFASILGLAAADAGAWDRARELEAMSMRSARFDGQVEGFTQILSARLAAWRGDPGSAKTLLRSALQSEPDAADKALLTLSDMVLKSEEEIGRSTEALRSDLRALSILERGSAAGSDAFEIEMRLLDREVGQEQVIAEISEGVERGLLAADRQAPLLAQLVSQPEIAELSRPLGLIYLDDPDRFVPALEQRDFRRALARSLSEIGAPAMASSILRAGDIDEASTANALAQAYLENEAPREALETAQAISDPIERRRIQAEALLLDRQLATAAPLLVELEDQEVSDAHKSLWERQINTALRVGDAEMALSGAEMLHRLDGSVETAERVVMFALDAGRDEMPAAAREILQSTDPGRLASLETLFESRGEGFQTGSAEAMSAQIDQLEEELKIIQGLISDG